MGKQENNKLCEILSRKKIMKKTPHSFRVTSAMLAEMHLCANDLECTMGAYIRGLHTMYMESNSE